MDKNRIKHILRENTIKEEGETAQPTGGRDERKHQTKDDTKYDRLTRLLDNNIFNHAGIIEKLWGDSDATNRSLFGKKLKRAKNDEGGEYQFSEEEISKILQILQNTSNDIKHTVDTKV